MRTVQQINVLKSVRPPRHIDIPSPVAERVGYKSVNILVDRSRIVSEMLAKIDRCYLSSALSDVYPTLFAKRAPEVLFV
jgi:hypothetical protein